MEINIILSILFAYIASIFLNRHLNKIIAKTNHDKIIPILWFIPVLCTIALLIVMLINSKEPNWYKWFRGEHWYK